MVGAAGFELATLCSQSRCSTRLSYAPIAPGHGRNDDFCQVFCGADPQRPADMGSGLGREQRMFDTVANFDAQLAGAAAADLQHGFDWRAGRDRSGG